MLEESEIPITSVVKEAGYTIGHFWIPFQKRWAHNRVGELFPRIPYGYYCPPWERDVDVSFVTESKVLNWDPLVHPGAIMVREWIPALLHLIMSRGYFLGEVNENRKSASTLIERPHVEVSVAKVSPLHLAQSYFSST